jgi:protein-L-isoaspartate(D-aspartate) O-methyltransferase
MQQDQTRWQDRNRMVDQQIRRRGIRDERTLAAMRKIPRHLFVPEQYQAEAYRDGALPIGAGQTVSQPFMVALMTAALGLKGHERVLEIGTGSGYQAAVLGELAREVHSVERHESLARQALQILHSIGYNNISVIVGDGAQGWLEAAPYDAIIVTAGAPSVPKALLDQLDDNGRLVIPVGSFRRQELVRITRNGTNLRSENLVECVFVPLIGDGAWDEEGSQERKD